MRKMREFKVDWYIDMSDLRDITKEIYGIGFDIQMGERGQGEYELVDTTKPPIHIQTYATGLGTGYGYDGKYIEGHGYKQISDAEAIAKWVSQAGTLDEWSRPFEKVGANGEYEHYQPDLEVVMADMVERNEIPEGVYFVSIDW